MIEESIGRSTEIIVINHHAQYVTEKIHVVKQIVKDIVETILETLRIIITNMSYISNTNRDKGSKAMIEINYQENQVPLVYFFTAVCSPKLTQEIDRLHKRTVKFLIIKASTLSGRIKKIKYRYKENIIHHPVIIVHTTNSSMTRIKTIEAIRFNLISDKIISIGDAPSDIEMSIKSNLKCSVLVETGQVPIYQLLKLSRFAVKDLSDIYIKKTF